MHKTKLTERVNQLDLIKVYKSSHSDHKSPYCTTRNALRAVQSKIFLLVVMLTSAACVIRYSGLKPCFSCYGLARLVIRPVTTGTVAATIFQRCPQPYAISVVHLLDHYYFAHKILLHHQNHLTLYPVGECERIARVACAKLCPGRKMIAIRTLHVQFWQILCCFFSRKADAISFFGQHQVENDTKVICETRPHERKTLYFPYNASSNEMANRPAINSRKFKR